MDEEELNKVNDLNKDIIEEVTSKISGDAVVEKVADLDKIMEEVTECIRTPRATLYEHNETPGGQRLTKSGGVQHKYIYCNKEGVPKDTKSYTWLLNVYMTAFSHEPTMIVTDQDRAMKRAIEAVFKKAKHRLCMWHIMQKIPSKICKEIYDETNFKERFDKIVCNMFIEPLKFEEKWSELIENFGLQSHKWLRKMYNLREIWIPTYFIDSPLYGLMRTTSRSESENSFFKSFTSHGATLVSFMMSYESAMERQRYRQETLDFKTIDAAPKCETKLEIERHVARVNTRTIFLLVQTEIIEGCWSCTRQEAE
nr:protein FAR1-related sequence 5-like [Tanacetum cinerariifolium]